MEPGPKIAHAVPGPIGQWALMGPGPIGPMGTFSMYTYLYMGTLCASMQAYLYKGFLYTGMNTCVLKSDSLRFKLQQQQRQWLQRQQRGQQQ